MALDVHTEPVEQDPSAVSVDGIPTATRSRWLIPGLFAATIAAIALLPRNAVPLAALLMSGAWVAVIALVRMANARRPSRQTARVLALSLAPVAVVTATSALAVDPRIALLGAVGQHVGAATWLVALLLLIVMALVARPVDLGDVVRATAGLGVLLSVSALLDAFGLLAGARYSVEASGLMENSIALGQVLVLSLACSVGWLVSTRMREQRAAAGTATVLVLAGLVVADSAGAWFGVAAGALLGVLVWWAVRRGVLHAGRIAAVLAVVMAIAVASLWVVLPDAADSAAWQSAADLTNDRSVIWSSALKQVAQAPVAGSGAEHFSAWVNWDSVPGVDLQQTATYDPHNIALWWMLSAGILGGVAAGGAAVALLWVLLDRAKRNPGAPVFAAIIGGAVGWTTCAMFGWINPLALAVLALVVGTVFGAARDVAADPSGISLARTAVTGCAVVAVGLVASLAMFGASAEMRWARAVDTGDLSAAVLETAFGETPDPAYAALLVSGGVTVDNVREIELVIDRSSVWHVDAALARLMLAGGGVSNAGDASVEDALAGAVASARKADPTSGLWEYVAAVYSEGNGDARGAAAYARKALEFPLPSGGVAEYLEALEGSER